VLNSLSASRVAPHTPPGGNHHTHDAMEHKTNTVSEPRPRLSGGGPPGSSTTPSSHGGGASTHHFHKHRADSLLKMLGRKPGDPEPDEEAKKHQLVRMQACGLCLVCVRARACVCVCCAAKWCTRLRGAVQLRMALTHSLLL